MNTYQEKHPLIQFIEEANQKYYNRYDYSKVVYKRNYNKVEIICPEHGSFWVTPLGHLEHNYHCHKCPELVFKPAYKINIYPIPKRTKETILYIIKYNNLYKIGITSRTVKKRFPHIELYTVISEYKFKDQFTARHYETEILAEYQEFKQEPIGWKGGGETEFVQINNTQLNLIRSNLNRVA